MQLGHKLLSTRSVDSAHGVSEAIEIAPPVNPSVAANPEIVVTDRDLLREFLNRGDEATFQRIVERHGAMVLGVASRVLRDSHLAEDVFQATFVVLARKASSVRKQTSLASWLHGVARRIATRYLQQQYRRGETPLRSEPTMEASPLEQVGSQWEQQILDEELQGLPESWREPLVLHELEGLSCQETADRLGLTLTALEGRLKRGRKELKHRLLRRGVGLGAVLTGLQATQASAASQPAMELILSTVQQSLDPTIPVESEWASPDTMQLFQHLATQELTAMSSIKVSTLIGVAGTVLVAVGAMSGSFGVAGSSARTGRAQPAIVGMLAAADKADASSDGTTDEITLDPLSTGQSADSVSDLLISTAEAKQLATASSQAGHKPGSSKTSAVTQKIHQALAERVDLEFIDTELSTVMNFLSEVSSIPIVHDSAKLTDLGVGLDTPINLVVPGVTLDSALAMMLRPLELDYIVRNEVLEITTREAAEQFMETKVYPLDRLPNTFRPEDVARVICRTVRPGSWGENPWVYIVPTPTDVAELDGGSGYGDGEESSYPGGGMSGYGESRKPVAADKPQAAIETLPGCLVVTHCQRAHREIAELLDQLQQMPVAPISPTYSSSGSDPFSYEVEETASAFNSPRKQPAPYTDLRTDQPKPSVGDPSKPSADRFEN